MSSSTNAFTRALSPQIESLAQVIISTQFGEKPPGNGNDMQELMTRLSNESLHVLHSKISNSRSVDAVIDAVPIDYRPRLKDRLLQYASWVDKLETVRTSFERLKLVISSGAVPQRLRVSAPVFQFTKEFRESDDASAAKAGAAFADAAATFQTSVTKDARTLKQAELSWWESRCEPDAQQSAFADDVNAVFADRVNSFKVPTIVYDAQGANPTLGAMVTSNQRISERDVLIRASRLFFSQIILIVQARHRAMSKVIEKKKEVASQADVEMADLTKPGPSLQSFIQKSLNAQIKKLALPTAAKKNGSGPSSSKAPPSTPSKPSTSTPSKRKAPSTKAAQKQKDKKTNHGKKGKASNPANDRKGKGGNGKDKGKGRA
ncbi:hypothetical protein D9619_011078 [Psilocybe cf. subviscida]|uniref:Uncharacterized protein n=1 Tax=Psilocybe cf. subviscida TaxID=2480587 RepID=A0A8H5BKE0_9AGAR|nr:hypothetical protein D9619_011078 [Psilocybe cf. subviscida]